MHMHSPKDFATLGLYTHPFFPLRLAVTSQSCTPECGPVSRYFHGQPLLGIDVITTTSHPLPGLWDCVQNALELVFMHMIQASRVGYLADPSL